MTLEAAAQLLASALMLLQAVSANPSLPQAVRDQAQATAQSAITEATRTIGRSGTSSGVSCTLTSDKYNYALGEVVVFDWTSTNAATLEFIPDAEGESAFPLPTGFLFPSGQYRKAVETRGYPFLTIKATGADGKSVTCSSMVHVQ
ncbi:MAG TPA: hypothetical protein VNM40_01065 [Candidatus Paceibacterota bacterium]|nr:hypothetical protein [Candidatus Paceibacterota bacterium]